jgi:hypothetical protein
VERSVKDMRQDCADAFQRTNPYHNELRSIYRYMMPWRQSTIERSRDGGGQNEGQSITDYIFDATGISSAANFAGTMMADWMPMHQEFFKLEAGPFIPDEAERDKLNLAFGQVTKRVHAVSARPQVTALEMMYDYFAGTGAMFLAKAPDLGTIANSAAVPMIEIALEEGPWGDVWGHYWKRNRKYKHLEALWPEGKFSEALKKQIKEKPRDDVEVVQYTYFEPKSRKWRLVVWVDKDELDATLHEEEFETCPWMTPRMFKMPGEANGRGLAHLALPFVKTANRGRELALKAAVFAILGIWLRRNDSVFNPETAVFDPGAMWAVSQTGGPFQSITRLPVPQDFDITSIVMQEEREQIRKVLLDDELPPEQDAVRSATEVAGRLRRYARNRGGTGGRLAQEFIVPYVQRMCDVLESHGLLPTKISIDDVVTRCTVTAPAAASQRTDKVEAWVNYTQIIAMLFGPQAAMLLTKVKSIPEMGRNLGLAEDQLPDKADLEKVEQILVQAAAANAVTEKDKPAAQPQPSPQQPYMNGGM